MSVENALDATFRRARNESSGVLIPYLTAGFPDREGFVDLAVAVLEAGADALEIGIPFSDPLLDGPSIQRSQQMALDAGTSPDDCLRFAREIHQRNSKPLLLMGAYNPVFAYGPERFCENAQIAGVSGLIIPDLPFDEADELRDAAAHHDLHVIYMVAPTSSQNRLRQICERASGFIYCVSVAGVTGTRTGVSDAVSPLVKRIRACTRVPIVVGFGISSPDQVRTVTALADGVAVGSALINVLHEAEPADRSRAVKTFISGLADAAHGA